MLELAALDASDRPPRDQQPEPRNHAGVGQVADERELQLLADQHVLRVADQGRR